MNIKVKTKDLLVVLRQLTSIVCRVNSKSIPILKNVRLWTLHNKLSLTTLDEDVTIIAEKMIDVETVASGETSVNARLLQKIVSKIPDKEISLSLNGSFLQIVAGCKTFEISTLDVADFPPVEKSAPVNTFVVKREDFIKALSNTFGTVSLDDTRKVLHGICVENNKQETTITSTNGKCLITMHIESNGENNFAFILPYKTAKLALKAFKKGDEHISFDLLENNRIMITCDDYQITSKLIDGTYPDYRQVIPDSYEHEVSVPLKEFKQNIDLIISFIGSYLYFDLEVADNKLSLTTHCDNLNTLVRFNSSIPVEYQDGFVKMVLNPSFLVQALKFLTSEKIKLHFSNNYSPIGITDDNDFQFVIMPLRNR